MNCLPWWAISLLSIAGFLLLILLFPGLRKFLATGNQPCPEESNYSNCDLQKCPNMIKKDLSHLLILFIIVLAFLISGPLYQEDKAMDFFSFASTIASIILSVVAIIFSITGESRTEGLKRVLDNAIKKLEETNANADAQKQVFEDILCNSKETLEYAKKINSGVENVASSLINKKKNMEGQSWKYKNEEFRQNEN